MARCDKHGGDKLHPAFEKKKKGVIFYFPFFPVEFLCPGEHRTLEMARRHDIVLPDAFLVG